MIRQLHRLFSARGDQSSSRLRRRSALRVEELESRQLLSGSSLGSLVAQPLLTAEPLNNPNPFLIGGYSPKQIRVAYGYSTIKFGTIIGDGTGQTIAIVDAYSQPNIKADLTKFDTQFALKAPPSFTIINQNGGTTLPAPDVNWGEEESLDVEWAHAIAPKANILLVEANSNFNSDLYTGVNTAKAWAGVSVVSMSFGASEFSGENSYDSTFVTPSGHQGVTFIAATGDNGAPGSYPAFSPNVLAVGGTRLSASSTGAYLGESGWSGSGGGFSVYEAEPSYQSTVQVSGIRTIPDVASDADPSTGVYMYDSYASPGGWFIAGGTSLAAPTLAGLVAIANQGRVHAGKATFRDTQLQSVLYTLPASDFHDITTGNNGYPAGVGYDLVTGIGSPAAKALVAGLVASNPSGPHVQLGGREGRGGKGWIGGHKVHDNPLLAARALAVVMESPQAVGPLSLMSSTQPETSSRPAAGTLDNNVQGSPSQLPASVGDGFSSPGRRNAEGVHTSFDLDRLGVADGGFDVNW
jgi:subtilase family serine protease